MTRAELAAVLAILADRIERRSDYLERDRDVALEAVADELRDVARELELEAPA